MRPNYRAIPVLPLAVLLLSPIMQSIRIAFHGITARYGLLYALR